MVDQAPNTVDFHGDVIAPQTEARDLESLASSEVAACRANAVNSRVDAHGPAVLTGEIAVSGTLTYEGLASLREGNVRLFALRGPVVADNCGESVELVLVSWSCIVGDQAVQVAVLLPQLDVVKRVIALVEVGERLDCVDPKVDLRTSDHLVGNSVKEVGREPLVVGDVAVIEIAVTWRGVFGACEANIESQVIHTTRRAGVRARQSPR